jgi:hypothetical protein
MQLIASPLFFLKNSLKILINIIILIYRVILSLKNRSLLGGLIMYFEAVILGIILGLIRGGSLKKFSLFNIRGWFLVLIGAALNLGVLMFKGKDPIAGNENLILFASLLVVALIVLINIEKKGFWAIFIGIALNITTVIMNGYKSPISLKALKNSGLNGLYEIVEAGKSFNYMSLDLVDNWTRFFGKYISIPSGYPFPKVLSPGDIMITLGIVLFIYGEMLSNKYEGQNMIRFSYNSRI